MAYFWKKAFSVIPQMSKNVPENVDVFEFQTVAITTFNNKQIYVWINWTDCTFQGS